MPDRRDARQILDPDQVLVVEADHRRQAIRIRLIHHAGAGAEDLVVFDLAHQIPIPVHLKVGDITRGTEDQ